MLQEDRIEVVIDGVFTVKELYPEETAKLIDDIRKKNEKKGDLEVGTLIKAGLFCERLISWGLDQECNDAHKTAFQRQYPVKSQDILVEANEKIEEEREVRLKNLLAGVSGS